MTTSTDRYLQQEVDAMADEPTINATCRNCDTDAEYQPSAFLVVTLETGQFILTHQYEFFCVICYGLCQYRIDKSVYDILVEAGVRTAVRMFPEEVAEQWARADLPPLGSNDLVDFLAALEPMLAVPSELEDAR